ncbi:MAG: LamG-like jellyroll fold domain-containing protein [bacterium]
MTKKSTQIRNTLMRNLLAKPFKLLAIVGLLLVGSLMNEVKAYDLSASDCSITWYKDQAAFLVSITTSDSDGTEEWFNWFDVHMNDVKITSTYGVRKGATHSVKNWVDSSVAQVMVYNLSSSIGQGVTGGDYSGNVARFWIYPTNPEQYITIKVNYILGEMFDDDVYASGYTTKYQGTPSTYSFTPTFSATANSTTGNVSFSSEVTDLNNSEYSKGTMYIQYSLDDGASYSDYSWYYKTLYYTTDLYSTSSSFAMKGTSSTSNFTAQQYANGIWMRSSMYTDPDTRGGYYSRTSYSPAVHMGATQAFADKTLTVTQNNTNISLKWTVVTPSGTNAKSQDMSGYQVERYMDGEWMTIGTVACAEGTTNYSFDYEIPTDERGYADYSMKFRVWKTRYDTQSVHSLFLSTNETEADINTKYKTVTLNNPNLSGTLATISWSTSSDGIWDSNVKLELTVTDVNTGTTQKATPSYDATSQDFTLIGCETYDISLSVTVDNVILETATIPSFEVPDDSAREINNLLVSKGYYNSYVRISWEVPSDKSDFDYFDIVRKDITTGNSVIVDQISHTGLTTYSYQDYGMDAGTIYEYVISGYSSCNNSPTVGAWKSSYGFSQPYATVSGRISYDGNQGVQGVAVSASSDDASASNKSLYFDGNSTSSKIEMPSTLFDFTENSKYSFQAWVNPSVQSNATTSEVFLFTKNSQIDIALIEFENGETAKIQLYLVGEDVETDITIPINEWSHITYTASVDTIAMTGQMQLYINGEFRGVYDTELEDGKIEEYSSSVCNVGANSTGARAFKGYIDELRFYKTVLDSATVASNYNVYLTGKESNLIGYYRLDEMGCSEIFDISASGSVFNMNDGVMGTMCTHSTYVPSTEQLSVKAYTDTDGNYLINTIPYTTEGMQYNITPTYGIHEFSPNKRPLYVSPSSVVFNNVDFDDVSSFPVSGVVYYEGTDVPVEGADLYVDGVICSSNGSIISTDDEGKFEISVPIGDHYITIQKNGHTFVNEGRYPSDANNVNTLVTFDQEVSGLTFYDNTLVSVAGRVVGGDIESVKPIGLAQSKNNIGVATLKLSVGSYRLNTVTTVVGTTTSFDDNPDNVAIESATDLVNSYSYRKGGNNEEVKYIYIITDSVTGEFSAMLPPLAYTVESVTINSTNESFSDLSNIDATASTMVYTDSITDENGVTSTFDYCTSKIFTKYEDTSFTMTDASNTVGAYGSETVEYSDLTTDENVTMYSVNESTGEITYTMGAPVFVKGLSYTFDLYGYQEYKNYDADANNPVTDKVPLQYSLVTITNEMSDGQTIYIESGTTEDGDDVEAGDFAALYPNQLTLDSLGMATYTWTVGYPNITAPYTRSISLIYEVNSEEIQWDGNGVFEGIVLGEMPSGNNFVTSGPDEILMILRDPAGSNSFSFWESGQTVTKEITNSGTGTVGVEVSTVAHLGATQNVIVGTPATGTITEAEIVSDIEAGINVVSTLTGTGSTSTTTTSTKTISTSDNEDYVGAHADVFIGTATNIIFGNARNVGLTRDVETGEYSIELEDVITTGSEFGTAFNYTQYYIEEVLIPNLYLNRNALIETVSSSDIDNIVNNGDELIYVSTLSSSDSRFGSKNTDTDIWGSLASETSSTMTGPSYTAIIPETVDQTVAYQDMVLWYNTQIETWERTLSDNEEAKVKAIDARDTYLSENLSFDQGVSIESSTSTCEAESTSQEWSIETTAVIGVENGLTVGGTGVSLKTTTTVGATYAGSNTDGLETCSTTGFTLQDDGLNDALSIDVLSAPDGFGAIFVTRGGQTSCPFEDATYTKYYEPGTELSAATMQVEIPVIEADNYYATDIASGGTATYYVEMRNDSETGDDVWFDIKVIDASNPDGASIKMDGSSLTESGRAMLVPAGGTLSKTIQLTQTQLDVLEYDNIAIALVSQCQYDPTGIFPVVADTMYISAQFVPTCSDITLSIAETTMNMFTSDTLTIEMTDFDRTYNTFESIRLQYKYANDVSWTIAKEYVLDEADVTTSTELLPTGGIISIDFPMSNSSLYPDGTYQFRLQTTCDYGTSGIYTESETVTVIKDMTPPQVIGTPNPSDGILSSGDDISVTFNEDIRNGSLTDANNFIVTGTLNDAEIAHSVALRLDGVDYAVAYTAADVHLANGSFAIDLWVNYTGAGTLIEHGSATNKFTAAINETGNLVVTIGDEVLTSTATIPSDSWCFITMNYNAGDYSNEFTALAANDASSIELFTAVSAPTYTGTGVLSLGKNLIGAMHEVALWNTARSTTTAQSEMYVGKAPSTQNLIGYWSFDEGYGLSASDVARNRHMTLAEATWFLNNENIAANLDGSGYLLLDISTVSAGSTDDYMMEMWFKGDAQTNAALFGADYKFTVLFNADGYLVLEQDGAETILSTNNYLDGSWHHIALNSLSNGYTTVYVDGVTVKQISSSLVETLQGSNLIIGATRTTNTSGTGGFIYDRYFNGDVDEIRYWVATLNGEYIINNRYNRIDIEDTAGLNAYYPFEVSGLDEANQVVYIFTLEDASENAVGAATEFNVTEATTAPGLKQAPELTNLQYTYVASEREIVITLTDEAYRLEGTTANFTVRNVRDENDNLMDPITWSAYINCNRLVWLGSSFELEQLESESVSFTTTISNLGSDYENWSISGMSTWMTATVSSGTLNPLTEQSITFTVDANMPIGSYEEVLYLSGNDGIYVSLPVALNVRAESPDWSVNPADFENSMAAIGTLSVLDVLSIDTDDILAAFIGETCVGIESPVYNSRYDAYFIMIDIYGNTDHTGKDVTFKVWDASTGVIHPVVSVSQDITFVSDNIIGGFSSPISWNAENYVEQSISMTSGWNWISLAVDPESKAISDVFETISDNASIVKNQTSFAQVNNDTWSGTLTEVDLSSMYRVQMNANDVLNISGSSVEADENEITVTSGWNWIGYSALFNLTVGDAFADLNPQTGDVVKSINGFAIYEGYEWIGKLTSLEPGAGYMYMSVSDEDRAFTYPATSTYTTASNMAASFAARMTSETNEFTPIETGTYSGNMTMVAVVKNGTIVETTAEVGVFAGEECRESQMSGNDGLVYLTIPGDDVTSLTFKVAIDNQIYTVDQLLSFNNNDHYGSVDIPYEIQLSPTETGVDTPVMGSGSISIYPNPANADVYVETDLDIVSIRVCSVAGAVLYETSNPTGYLDFSAYTEGVYVVVLVDSNGITYVERVIKK